MLKSTFKKVSAIAIAGTMLAGMMAVPANAMTAQTVNEDVVIPVISENFDNAALGSYAMSTTTKTIPDITNISFSKVESWNDRRVSIIEDGTVHAMKFHTGDGVNLKIASPDGNTIPLQLGDKVNISFKFKYLTATEGGKTDNTKLQLYLNDKTTSKTNFISTNNTGGWMESGTSDVGGITVFTPNNVGGYASNTYGAPTHSAGEWNTLNIVIDTQDVAKNNAQTIKTTLTKADNTTVYYYYKFDADYTGESDTTITPFSTLESLNFYTNYTNGSEFCIDDVTVTVEGTRSHTEYVSDLSKVVLDENFDNFTGTVTEKGALTGTKFTMSKSWGPNNVTVEPVNGAAHISGGASSEHFIRADFTDVAIGADDIIRVSYDRTMDNGGDFTSYLSMTGTTKPAIKLTHVKRDTLTGTGAIDSFVEGVDKIRPGGIQTPNEFGGDRTLLPGKVYHVEYIIKVSDPEYGNKQTVTVKVADDEGKAGNWNGTASDTAFSQTYYLDANKETTEEDKFTSLSAFTLYQYWSAPDVTVDNVKVEVIKPGFEVVDVNNSTNTWTFSGTAPIELNYVTNASAASKVIVAQYAEGGRLIKAEPANVAASGRGTVTVTPVANANMIKLMVLDMSTAIPYAKVFKLTKSN